MNSTALPYWLSLVVIVVGGIVAWTVIRSDRVVENVGSYGEADPDYTDAPLTEFELATSTGGVLNSGDMLGQVWVGSFFFTACPGPCLKMNQALDVLHDDPALADVKYVSITCDPPNDTLEVLQKYAEQFGSDPERWLFCRGNLNYVQKIGTDILKLTVRYQTHAQHAVMVGRDGMVKGRFDLMDPVQVISLKQSLAAELKKPAPQEPSQEEAAAVE